MAHRFREGAPIGIPFAVVAGTQPKEPLMRSASAIVNIPSISGLPTSRKDSGV